MVKEKKLMDGLTMRSFEFDREIDIYIQTLKQKKSLLDP